jgi:hypothetical protein
MVSSHYLNYFHLTLVNMYLFLFIENQKNDENTPRKTSNKLGDVTQLYNTCLAWAKPWVWAQELPKIAKLLKVSSEFEISK